MPLQSPLHQWFVLFNNCDELGSVSLPRRGEGSAKFVNHSTRGTCHTGRSLEFHRLTSEYLTPPQGELFWWSFSVNLFGFCIFKLYIKPYLNEINVSGYSLKLFQGE